MPTQTMSPHDALLGSAAAHEAAHALCATDHNLQVHAVSITPLGAGTTELDTFDPKALRTIVLGKTEWGRIYGTVRSLLAGPTYVGQSVRDSDFAHLCTWQRCYSRFADEAKTDLWPVFLSGIQQSVDLWCISRTDAIQMLALRLCQRRTMLAQEWSQAVAEANRMTRGASRYRVA